MKNKAILYLVLLSASAASCAVGYFVTGLVLSGMPVHPTASEPYREDGLSDGRQSLSVIPEIVVAGTPRLTASGRYDLNVEAGVQSGDGLAYVIYGDEACMSEVGRNSDGRFSGLAPSPSGTYWLRAMNVRTGDFSESVPVNGFRQVVMYEKITAAELEKICNSGNFASAPPKFHHRISPSLVIVPNGMDADERGVSTIADVCQKMKMDVWHSIKITGMEYDSQNRLCKVVFDVKYW